MKNKQIVRHTIYKYCRLLRKAAVAFRMLFVNEIFSERVVVASSNDFHSSMLVRRVIKFDPVKKIHDSNQSLFWQWRQMVSSSYRIANSILYST